MKKESVIVGIFGLSLGLLVAWAIWNFKGAAPKPQELAVSPSPAAYTSPTPTPTTFLTLDSPQEGFLATGSSILVSGKAKPSSTVVISTNLDDFVLTASSNGNFSQDVDLEEGENLLTISSYSSDKKEETIEKTVTYTKETL